MTGSAVWIGLDALDLQEVRRRIDDLAMPNLAALEANGRLRPLEPDVPGFAGSVWRSFVNGCPVGEHGWYFNKMWRPGRGRMEAARPDWLRLEPFWDDLSAAGARLALIDVPYAPDPGESFDGVYLSGWQTHDSHERRSRPADLLGTLEASFGRPWLGAERYGPQRAKDLLRLHQQALASIQQIGALGEWLLLRDRFDLFLMVIGGPHRAGHYLWDLSQIDAARLPTAERRVLQQAMDDVYMACDVAVGRIAAAAPADAQLAVFALHGMGPNPGWTDAFPAMIGRVHAGPGGGSASPLRHAVQGWLRSPTMQRASRLVPRSVHARLGRAFSTRVHDWASTRFFAMPTELGGSLRLNLAGRERLGIVPPGLPAEALTDELADTIAGIEELDGGAPVVAAVRRVDDLVAPSARFRRYLPDLLVEWNDRRIGDSIGVRIPAHGEMRWRRGRRLNSGRSGNHRPQGWVVGEVDLPEPRHGRRQTVLDLVQALLRRFRGASAPAAQRARERVHSLDTWAPVATLLLLA